MHTWPEEAGGRKRRGLFLTAGPRGRVDPPPPWWVPASPGRTRFAQSVQGALQLGAGEAAETRGLAEEGEAHVRAPSAAAPSGPALPVGVQLQSPLLLGVVA